MTPQSGLLSRRREQRVVLLIGILIASFPVLCEILVLGAMRLHAGAFPLADRALTDDRFWSVQIILLCVSVAGNAMVDWIRVMRRPGQVPGKLSGTEPCIRARLPHVFDQSARWSNRMAVDRFYGLPRGLRPVFGVDAGDGTG